MVIYDISLVFMIIPLFFFLVFAMKNSIFTLQGALSSAQGPEGFKVVVPGGGWSQNEKLMNQLT